MDAKAIEVVFEGRDFSRVEDTKVYIKSDIPEEIKNLIIAKKSLILKQFMDEVDLGEIEVNHSKYMSKKKNTHYFLYRNRDDGLVFDGLAGVINKKDFKILKSKLLPETTEEEIIELDITLKIVSRFDSQKPFFLSTMLMRDGIRFTDDTVPSGIEQLYDYLLIFIFKRLLEKALKKGFYKSYKQFHNNDDRVKGAIDIPRYIRENLGNDGSRIPYKYRENSYSNDLNQLIVVSYSHIKNRYPGIVSLNFDSNNALKKSIEMLKSINTTNSDNVINNNRKPITHPFYSDYEELRRVCLRILANEKVSFGDGKKDRSLNGFLFYLPDLWELYLEDIIKANLRGSGISVKSQGGTYGIKVLEKAGKYMLSTYPDFVFCIDGNPSMILDAKFRPAWDVMLVEYSRNVFPDILEDYTKCIRDMNTIQSHSTGVIYPTKNIPDGDYFLKESIVHKISEYNSEDKFLVFPIAVPTVWDDMSYKEWKSIFQKYTDKSLDNIVKAIKKNNNMK